VKTSIDGDLCTGHGRCYGTAPEVYDADDEGRGVVLTPDVPAEFQDRARQAAAECPERAVRVHD
jgi:ferredoxin